MKLKPDQERVKSLLKDTITLLCKNGLSFETKFSIEAVIGVTLDDKDVFLISVNEIVKATDPQNASNISRSDTSSEEGFEEQSGHSPKKRKRKRKHHQSIKAEDQDGSYEDSSDRATTSGRELLYSDEPIDKRPNVTNKTGIEPSRSLLQCTKIEDQEEDNDIVFVKQELEENWPGSSSCTQVEPQDEFMDYGHMDPSNVDINLSNKNLSDKSFTQDSVANMEAGYGDRSYVRQRHSEASLMMTPESMQQGTSQGYEQGQVDLNSQIFKCSRCDRSYKNRRNLEVHEKWHEGIFPYRCSICNKGCMSSSSLEGHMSWHTGMKFKCSTCGKQFRYRQDYKQHIQLCRIQT